MKLIADYGSACDIEAGVTGLVRLESTDIAATTDYFNAGYLHRSINNLISTLDLIPDMYRVEINMIKTVNSKSLHVFCFRFVHKDTHACYPADGYYALAPRERDSTYPQVVCSPDTDPKIADLTKRLLAIERAVNGIAGTLKLNKQHYAQAETIANCMETHLRDMYAELATIRSTGTASL